MAEVQVSKEYVREQLHAMGVRNLSEQELESYTRDFARLIQEHLQHDSSLGTSSGESFGTTSSSNVDSTLESSAGQTPPLEASHLPHRQPQCAVFKTFPGDKENEVRHLPASATPSPIRPLSDHTTTLVPPGGAAVRRKRKVLRRVNGESQVFDESYNTVEDSPSVSSVTSDLSDLSLTSVSLSESELVEQERPEGAGRKPRPKTTKPHLQYKAFIRPSTCQLHSRRVKKHDPVARYHEWKQIWQTEKVPGEDNRSSLRWQIREQMMHQDLPFFVPPRRMVKLNSYVVPTDKKRLSLRWAIRHQMAQQH